MTLKNGAVVPMHEVVKRAVSPLYAGANFKQCYNLRVIGADSGQVPERNKVKRHRRMSAIRRGTQQPI